MNAIEFAPTEEKYPAVSQTKTRIYELEIELQEVRHKERLKLELRGALLGSSPTEPSDRRLNEVEAEILTLQAQKTRLTDRIDELKRTLPQIEAEAKQTETALETAQENRKTIKGEISDLDNKINKSLEPLMDLIQKRKEAINRLEKAGNEISTLTSELRWHPPTAEYPPALPEMLRMLKEVLDKLFPRNW